MEPAPQAAAVAPPSRALVWLARAAAVAALLALTLIAGRVAERRAEEAQIARVAAALPLAQGALTGVIEKQRMIPAVLARDPEVAAALRAASPRTETGLDAKLAGIAAEAGATVIYVIDADGIAIAASNAEAEDSFVGSDYGFRTYFTRALRDGAAAQYALGTVSKRPGLYLSHRVDDAGGPLGVVVVKVELDDLEARWRESGMIAEVTDTRGIVLATSMPERRFTATGPLEDPEEARRVLQLGETKIPVVPIDWVGEGFARLGPRLYASAAGEVPEAGLDWRLTLFAPVGTAIAAAAWNTRVTVLLAGTLIGAAAYALHRRRRRAAERARALAAMNAELERRVALRTRELTTEMAERAQAEERARRLREDLAQANRLSILGQVAAGVAHEINQPLAAIRAYAETGARLAERGMIEETRGNLGEIARVADRIGTITGSLRGFARRGAGEERPVAVEDAVDGALALLAGRIRDAGVEIRRAPRSGVAVRAGRIRLEQILMNLLGNALDALKGHPEPVIEIGITTPGETVAITIRDNGPGIDADARGTLFMPFNTTKPTGLGLGLVISEELAREFGGALLLDPPDGAPGASFTLELRRAE